MESALCRLSLSDPIGVLPALNAGLQAWGHPGLVPYVTNDPTASPSVRITTTTDAKFFEVGFFSPEKLVGDASRGWVDSTGRVRVWCEWSEDLRNWQTLKFVDCSGSPTAVTGGWEYWQRCIYTVDTKVKTGHMWCEQVGGDARNNPFTSLTINDVVQSLANFPYTMPGGASQMQTDIRALGWTDATVVATSDVDWRFDIPGVNFTYYNTTNKVGWPQYLVENSLGQVVNPVNGAYFLGEFVDANGLRCALNKQFFRLVASAL